MTTSQLYRNARTGFYTDLTVDTTPVGAIVPNLKTGTNSLDHNFVKFGATTFPALTETTGNAYAVKDNPAYTHEGYLYCNGDEFNIGDFPGLFELIGNKYGGRASSGIDVTNGGSGYTTLPLVGITAPGGGQGVQATAGAVVENGVIVRVDVVNPGAGYSSPPTIQFTGGNGSGATAVARINTVDGSIEGINTNNVMDYWGDPYLGTFKVPDLRTRKIVGNGPVFGNNSPNVGNSTLGVGTTGGAWYLDKDAQDEYFSLGRIVTTGYENVVETVECTIIGQQQIDISMRETKLSGAPQHSHTVYHTVPGFNSYQAEAGGDRYLQDYREGRGRLARWYPTGGIVFTHKHGLLRSPITDNTVATYDVFDAFGGAGGVGSLKDPTASANEQFYMASGAQGAGSYIFQTYIPDPVMKQFTGSSNIGGRTVNTGGTPVYDYSDEWTYSSPGSYSINLGNISGTPDRLIYTVVGGGGSGAAGNVAGNDGGNSSIVVGSDLNLVSAGGGGGGASNGQQGGQGGAGGTATQSGSVSATGNQDGQDGGAGANGQTSDGWPIADFPNDPGGGGTAGVFGDYGNGTAGINLRVGGQSGTYTETLNTDGTFNTQGITNPSAVQFTVRGGNGGTARGNRVGYQGAVMVIDMIESQLSSFGTGGWNVKVGSAGGTGGVGNNPGVGGTNSMGANGGTGGTGHNDADGGGGGAAGMVMRGTQILGGAAGGGGGGGDGYDGGAGQNGQGPPSGYSQPDGTTQPIGPGAGGNGGNYGCIGGGGGAGGAGVARNGISFGGQGNGGASGGPGGGPGADGGHGGGSGGVSGVSSYRSDWFSLNSFSHSHNGTGGVTLSVTYNNDYWTAGGGGGGSGGNWGGSIQWTNLNNPSSVSVTVGSGGAGVSPGGQTTGSTSSGDGGYVKIGLGKIVGYTGGSTGTSTGDIIASGSQSNTVWDVNIVGNGTGTGTAGNFKLPTTQVPDVYIVGGGATTAATASVTVASNKVTAINLDSAGGGYTEIPYIYVMNGAGGGTKVTSTVDDAAGVVDQLFLTANSSSQYTNYVKFGGLSGTTGTRYITLNPVDTTNCNYFSIKACRGNGVNGGNVPEEVLRVYYQPADSTSWTLIDTIITPNSVRTDPIIGDVPVLSQAWDGASGATKWYTYSVAMPIDAKAVGTKIKIEQPRATPSAANDNDADSDHYGICEFIYWNEKVSGLVFVPTAGKISKPGVDSLSYTVQGETGPGITYSSGLGASEATLTLKSTTKIEPQATIDPDIDVPLLHPYILCKYLIKAF